MRDLIALWALLQLVFGLAYSLHNQNETRHAFEHEVEYVRSRVAGRIAQHDAVLLSLAAHVQSAPHDNGEAFKDMAGSVVHAFDRIKRIQYYSLEGSDSTITVSLQKDIVQAGWSPLPLSAYHSMSSRLPQQVGRKKYLTVLPESDGQYAVSWLINSGRAAIALTIDGYSLLSVPESSGAALAADTDIDARNAPSSSRSRHPHPSAAIEHAPDLRIGLTIDGAVVVPVQPAGPAQSYVYATLSDTFDPGVYDHPFVVQVDRSVSWFEIFDWRMMLFFGAATGATLFGLRYGGAQALRSRILEDSVKAAERRVLQLEHETKLAHASRVNDMGSLASGIAHELTQPLTALLSQSQAGLKAMETGRIRSDLLERALKANVQEAQRAGRILKRMRDYVSLKKTEPAVCNLNDVVAVIIDLLRHELRTKAIDVTLDLHQPSPLVLAGEIELEQVVYNLMRNAIDAIESRPKPVNTIRISTVEEADVSVIEIQDNGPGIPQAILDQIFDPFFSTKDSGMGIGLALCAKLLERYGGAITAESVRGALFRITLPRLSGRHP